MFYILCLMYFPGRVARGSKSVIYYLVIDTNVLVSAVLKSHAVLGSIVELVFDGAILPVLKETIEKEYWEVLFRPKFHLPQDCIEGIMSISVIAPFMLMQSFLT